MFSLELIHLANLTLSENVKLLNNRIISGAASILVQCSTLSQTKRSYANFEGNFATNNRGVFYISANKYVHFGDNYHFKYFLFS